MQFKVLHVSSKRIRIQTSIKCTLDVQDYIMDIASGCKAIQRIHFYNDLHVFALLIAPDETQAALQFLKKIDPKEVKKRYNEPSDFKRETPYSIVSSEIGKRILYQSFLPASVRVLLTCFKALRYVRETILSLARKQITMDTLDGTAIAISVLTKQFETASSIMFLLELGERLGSWSQKKSFSDLEKSLESNIKDVWIIKDGVTLKVPFTEVALGDILLVSEGNEILFDGTIASGKGAVNESSITGEFFPVIKQIGDSVYSNTVLERGELHIQIENVQANARIHQLIQLLKETDALNNSKQYQFISAADKLVKFNFLGSVVTYLLTRSFSKAISFLLVDYSCSLKLSTPVIYLSAIQRLMDQGIVVKNTSTLDIFAAVDTFVFDKTGTITHPTPIIYEILTFHGYEEEEVLKIGACLEEHIYHPIAKAVVNKAQEKGIDHPEMHEELFHIASKGVVSTINHETVVIGNLLLMEENDIEISEEQRHLIASKEEAFNLLYLGYKKQLIAIFCINISLRQETPAVLEALKASGKRLVLLTGDRAKRTHEVSQGLPFDQIVTEATPVSKHAYILEQRHLGHTVLMVGDGLNDSAALAASDISVSMGDGADLTRQVSDILLTTDSITSLLTLQAMSHHVSKKVNTNVAISVSVNTSLIGLGLLSLVPNKTLALLHNLTTFGIILTSFEVKS